MLWRNRCVNKSALIFEWNFIESVFVVIGWNRIALVVQLRFRLLLRNSYSYNWTDRRCWINRLIYVVFHFCMSSHWSWVFITIELFFFFSFLSICFLSGYIFFCDMKVDFSDPLGKFFSAYLRHFWLKRVQIPETFVNKIEDVLVETKSFLIFFYKFQHWVSHMLGEQLSQISVV